jgi:putative phage-type endonuclease
MMDELSPERSGRVTASSAGAILGLSPHQTAADIMRRMVREYHDAPDETPDFLKRVVFAYGHNNETRAKLAYMIGSGEEPINSKFYKYEHWLGATPDGEIDDDGLLEIKTPYGKRDGGKLKTLDEQPHYYAQIQVQMFCAKKSRCDFYQWSPHGDALETVHYNQDWIDENLPKLKLFYERYLVERAGEAAKKHLAPRLQSVDTAMAALLIDEYDQLSEAIDLATERKKEVLAALVKVAGDKSAEICGRKLTKVERAGSVSYAKAIKELLPNADLAAYTGKPSEYWILT